VPALERMQPLAGVRGMDRDVLDRRWGELGAGRGGEGRGSVCAVGGLDGGPADGGCGGGWLEVEKKLLGV
jgi:hypothetical protein